MKNVNRDGITINYDERSRTSDWWNGYNTWEKDVTLAMNALCNPNKVSIDLGAWNGVHTIYMAHLSKMVVAVEPDPLAWQDLQLNLLCNDVRNKVQSMNVAIGEEYGIVKLGAALGLSGSSMVLTPDILSFGEPINVQCITFEHLLEECGITPKDIGFIKVDIEGAEKDVIPAIIETLAGVHGIYLHVSFHAGHIGNDYVMVLTQNLDVSYERICQFSGVWKT